MTTSVDLSLGQVIVLLTHEHDDQTAIDLTRKYCLQSTSYEIQRKGMEFLYIHGFYEELQQLVEKNKESDHELNRQWAYIYQLTIDRRFKKKSPLQIVKYLDYFQTSDIELRTIIELTKVSLYHDLKQFNKIGNFLDVQYELFDRIEDNFLFSCLNFRLYQLLFIYYWSRNELIMARKYAFRALNQTNNGKTKANLHMNLGLTYLFDTYHQGMYHLQEGLRLAIEYQDHTRIKIIKNKNIPFFAAHFKKTEGITTNDKSEQAHLEIARGNNKAAIAILETLPLTSPFELYYMGLAKQDEHFLLQSYYAFTQERNEYFFSRLPLNELTKLREKQV